MFGGKFEPCGTETLKLNKCYSKFETLLPKEGYYFFLNTIQTSVVFVEYIETRFSGSLTDSAKLNINKL